MAHAWHVSFNFICSKGCFIINSKASSIIYTFLLYIPTCKFQLWKPEVVGTVWYGELICSGSLGINSIRWHIAHLMASWLWWCLFIACHSETYPALQRAFHSWWQFQLWNYNEKFPIESAGQTHLSSHRLSRCWVPGSYVKHMAKQLEMWRGALQIKMRMST